MLSSIPHKIAELEEAVPVPFRHFSPTSIHPFLFVFPVPDLRFIPVFEDLGLGRNGTCLPRRRRRRRRRYIYDTIEGPRVTAVKSGRITQA
jgi:hypothetical protein